ncbi:hypothetical protein OAE15_00120, partial [Verrucomicrobiales bacterium]|nr:hypothetical protein [Verrucomicrobiales bacterium]
MRARERCAETFAATDRFTIEIHGDFVMIPLSNHGQMVGCAEFDHGIDGKERILAHVRSQPKEATVWT